MEAASPLFEDTIAALATPAGRSAIAVVRVSGPGTSGLILRLCPSLGALLPEPRLQHLLPVRDPGTGELLDRALVTWFPGPRSYTGEDIAEISTHGGVLGPQLVLAAALAAGARPAEPGEFTRRAVFNGKLDLLQAEAIADLIDGRSLALRRAAINQMDRGLSERIQELRSLVLRVEGLVAYDIDFPDEDEPPVPAEQVVRAAAAILDRVEELLDTAPQGEMLREGALVVLAGRPNSGKSSLFNALLGAERAIVTAVPGTTRDALEATVLLDGYPFRLVDTAGLRETDEQVERIGIEVARRYLAAADIILFCSEHGEPLREEESAFLGEAAASTTVLLRTKADLQEGPVSERSAANLPTGDGAAAADLADRTITVSALSGHGLADLRTALVEAAFGGRPDPGVQPIVTRARQARALQVARDEIRLFLEARDSGVPPELASTHLRAAASALELLVGVLTPDDILGEVFQSFCVGK